MTKKTASEKLELAVEAVNKLRAPLLWFMVVTYPIVQWILSLGGVKYFLIQRTANHKTSNPAIDQLEQLLNDAVEIQIAVGEAGHRLMEHPGMLIGLKTAFYDNHASIKIIHGPRVDPLTHTIFEYAQTGMLTLYRMPKYARHHFLLITNRQGITTLIDEGIHNEAIWKVDDEGKVTEILASKARLYYITERANRVIDSRRKEFQKRKSASQVNMKHPYLNPPQNYHWLRYILEALFSLPIKHALQPLASFFNLPLDSLLSYWYKDKEVMQESDPQLQSAFDDAESEPEIEYPISMFDEPDVIRGLFNPETGRYEVGLKYIGDREPRKVIPLNEVVAAEVGKNSKRVFVLQVDIGDPQAANAPSILRENLAEAIRVLQTPRPDTRRRVFRLDNFDNYGQVADAISKVDRLIPSNIQKPFKLELIT